MKYRDGFRYQLMEDEVFKTDIIGYSINTKFIKLTVVGVMTVKAGYAWDGADVVPDVKCILRGSLGHDAGYQLIEEGLLPASERVYVDQLLSNTCIEDGMPEFIAKSLVFNAVQKFGLSHIRSKETLTAP